MIIATQPLVVARGWLPSSAPVSWRAQYLSLRGKLCRDCGVVSDYCFPLLGASYRLCEKCEAADPRYALLTAAQAEDSFGLSAEQLSALPCREVRGLRSRAVEKRLRVLGQATLYLRSHVEALAAEQERGATQATASNDAADDSDNDSGAEAEDAEADEEQFALEDDGCDGTPTRRRLPPQTPEAAREAAKRERKANKAAVKAANRERRQSKAAGLPPSASEPRRTYAALSRSPGAAALPPRPGSSPQLAVPPGTSPQARSFGTSPQMRGCGGRGGSKAAHSREAARALAAGASPNSGGPLARAWLEDELGEFGISGLERAD